MNVRGTAWSELTGILFAADHIPSQLAAPVWLEIASLSNHLLVGPTLAARLIASGAIDAVPDDTKEYLQAMYRYNQDRNGELCTQLQRIAAALNAIGIRPMPIKGMALLLADAYGDPGARYVGDIDLVVPQDKVDNTQDVLKQLGYVEVQSTIDPQTHWHAYPMVHPEFQVCVEVHRRAVPIVLEPHLQGDLADRAAPLAVGDAQVLLPNSTDSVRLTVAHSELIDGQIDNFLVPLRALLDVSTLCKTQQITPWVVDDPLVDAALRRFAAVYSDTTGRPLTCFPTPGRVHRMRAELTRLALQYATADLWLNRYVRLSPPILDRLEMNATALRRARWQRLKAMWLRQTVSGHASAPERTSVAE